MHHRAPSQQALLSAGDSHGPSFAMAHLDDKSAVPDEAATANEISTIDTATTHTAQESTAAILPAAPYKVYKRRFFGLVQLVLLNVVVSWDVSGARWRETAG
jgi:hypothetical protein